MIVTHMESLRHMVHLRAAGLSRRLGGINMRLEGIEMIPIWGDTIPGNSDRSKMDVLNPKPGMTMEEIFTSKGGIWDKVSEGVTDMTADDTMVLYDEIEGGYANDTYTDVPFLVPYIVEGSDKCVISCPGGAYMSKSMEGEGKDIAAFLNAAGISCFVLWYRTYPYRTPLMFLDCQRAVKYVRAHAAEYGINPDKIATVGFSAGGNLVGVQMTQFTNTPVEVEGYTPDEIDAVDGTPNAVGLIYPAIDVKDDKIIAVMAGLDVYNDYDARIAYGDSIDVTDHLSADNAPTFFAMAMDDFVINPSCVFRFGDKAKELGVSCEIHMYPTGGHGFGGCVEKPLPPGLPFPAPDYSYCKEWRDSFVHWLNIVLA